MLADLGFLVVAAYAGMVCDEYIRTAGHNGEAAHYEFRIDVNAGGGYGDYPYSLLRRGFY